MKKINILLLYDREPRIATTLDDHLNSIKNLSRHKCYSLAMLGDLPKFLDLGRFDAIIIHYSLMALHDVYISHDAKMKIRKFAGLKAMFIQDEYRSVNKAINAMLLMKIDLLFTNFPEEEFENVYPKKILPKLEKVNVLTGYMPSKFKNYKKILPSQRELLVGYRGRKLPDWLGELGQEKYHIGVQFEKDLKEYPSVNCDISFREEDRIYGEGWIKFLLKCRAVLGVETGASVVDLTGDIQRNVEDAIKRNPEITFDQLKNMYFKNEDKKIKLNQISARCFEAAALRTVMILYEGEYSNRLTPWRHYIPLKKDHSNMSKVIDVLKNDEKCDEIAELAYKEVALEHKNSYEYFISVVDTAIDSCFKENMRSKKKVYSALGFRICSIPSLRTINLKYKRYRYIFVTLLLFRVIFRGLEPEQRDIMHSKIRDIYYKIMFYKKRV